MEGRDITQNVRQKHASYANALPLRVLINSRRCRSLLWYRTVQCDDTDHIRVYKRFVIETLSIVVHCSTRGQSKLAGGISMLDVLTSLSDCRHETVERIMERRISGGLYMCWMGFHNAICVVGFYMPN